MITDDKGDAYFLEQSIVRDHFDGGQRERFRYEHCRFMSLFRSSGVSELFGVIPAAGFGWNT